MRFAVLPSAAELMTRALEKYNPLQPRDDGGQWTDGMPDDVVSSAVKVMGGTVTASSKRGSGGKATLSANGRSVDLDDRDINELRKTIIDAQYGDDGAAGPDGVYRVVDYGNAIEGTKPKILVSLRPVEGKFISETGKKFSNPDDGLDDEEYYNAEFDMVVGEGSDGEFADYPSIRVSLKDLDTDENNLKGLYAALERATAARRVDTGNGPTDVFSPRAGVVGFRMKDDNGDPTEVTFNAGEARRLKSAMEDVLYGEGEGIDDLSIPRDDEAVFETSGGPVVARFKGHRDDREWRGTLTLLPDNAPWSVAVDGPAIDEFLEALNRNGAMAGIRSFEAVQPVIPAIRSLEAFKVLSPSPAVQLMMYARVLEMAADSFLRRGKLVHVERGRGGKFASKASSTVADVVDAAQKMSDAFDGRDSGTTMDKLRAMRANPKPEDLDRVAELLGSMKHKDLDEIAREFGIENVKGTKAQKQQKLADRLVGSRLDMDAIMRVDVRQQQALNAYRSIRSESGQDKHLIGIPDEPLIAARPAVPAPPRPRATRASKTDMSAIAARIKALPPKGESKEQLAAELDGLGAADMRAVADAMGINHLPKRATKAQSRQAIEERLQARLDHEAIMSVDMRSPFGPQAVKGDADSYFGRFAAGFKAANERERQAKLKAKPTAAQPAAARPRRGKADASSAVDALRPMVDNPQGGDRERTDKILGKLTSKQLDEVARTFNVTLGPSRNVAHKRSQIREWLVGTSLNSQAIARGTAGYLEDTGIR